MASYLVLTSPGAAVDDDKVRFIRDQGVWLGFVFPAIWLLSQRQWIAGIGVALIQTAIAVVSSEPGTMIASVLVEMALRLLVALEGPAFVANRLEAKGWQLRDIIPADDLETAEMLYAARHDAGSEGEKDWQHPDMQPVTDARPLPRPAFGLFGSYGER